jgi:hypothetical protein
MLQVGATGIEEEEEEDCEDDMNRMNTVGTGQSLSHN